MKYARVLDWLVLTRGLPRCVVCDNGRCRDECVNSIRLTSGLAAHWGVRLHSLRDKMVVRAGAERGKWLVLGLLGIAAEMRRGILCCT